MTSREADSEKGRGVSGEYLSEFISHEEGRGVSLRLHVSHMGRSGGIDMVGRKHLQWNQKETASYLLRNENQCDDTHIRFFSPTISS